MDRISMRLAAALFLTAAPLIAASPTLAQDKRDDRPSMGQDRGGPAPETKGAPNDRQPANAAPREMRSDRPASKADDGGKSRAARDEKSDGKEAAGKGDREQRKADQAGRDDKPDADTKRSADDAQGRDRSAPDRSAQDKDIKQPSKADADDKNTKPSADTAAKDGKAAGDREAPDKVKSANLSGDKREKVTTTFRNQSNVKRITNVNVDISIGKRAPREWTYYPVPVAVIEIVPEYRGYRYVYVEDRYVIVDPDTYEVVYVIETSGSGPTTASRSTSGGAVCSSDLSLTSDDRVFIIEKVRRSSATAGIRIGDLRIGFEVPSTVEVHTFPADVTSRVSALDSCRYVVVEDRVAIIDPREDKVITVIE